MPPAAAQQRQRQKTIVKLSRWAQKRLACRLKEPFITLCRPRDLVSFDENNRKECLRSLSFLAKRSSKFTHDTPHHGRLCAMQAVSSRCTNTGTCFRGCCRRRPRLIPRWFEPRVCWMYPCPSWQVRQQIFQLFGTQSRGHARSIRSSGEAGTRSPY
jgi:hypothetical protein